jgi:hypothetical protein
MADFEDSKYSTQDNFSIRLSPILRYYLFQLSEENKAMGLKFKFSTYVSRLIHQDMKKKLGEEQIKQINTNIREGKINAY